MVTTAQQYFRCRPYHASDISGHYFLGKALLQAVSMGMNQQEERFYLAQTPGPGLRASTIRPITSQETVIGNDPIDSSAVTWEKDWTMLSDTRNSNNGLVNSSGATDGQESASDAGKRLVCR